MRFFVLLLAPLVLFQSVFCRELRVGKGHDFKSIKSAISAARPGDTVLIAEGIYKEGNIVIEKSLVLIGENYPVLDGENNVEIFTIHANNVVIRGLHFKNTGIASIIDLAAIKVLDSRNALIIKNKFQDTFFGIYFSNSAGSSIIDNDLKANAAAEHQIGNGIHLWRCDSMSIIDNAIQGHRDGIYFEFVTNSEIANNHSEGNMRYGLHFMFSHNDEYRDNVFVNNGAGVAVMYTKEVRMFGNTFEHNWGPSSYGLLLKDIRDSKVIGNIFKTNTVGVYMEGVSRTLFEENTFSSNGYAVRMQASCDDNQFKTNNFKANTFDITTNGSLVLNTINGNYWDQYEGYDLNKDGIGDVPHRPMSMYSMIVERVPASVMLWRSFLVFLLDNAERALPVITPENLKDTSPTMRPHDLTKSSN
jgi:nitrous oxidase accessory protein